MKSLYDRRYGHAYQAVLLSSDGFKAQKRSTPANFLLMNAGWWAQRGRSQVKSIFFVFRTRQQEVYEPRADRRNRKRHYLLASPSTYIYQCILRGISGTAF